MTIMPSFPGHQQLASAVDHSNGYRIFEWIYLRKQESPERNCANIVIIMVDSSSSLQNLAYKRFPALYTLNVSDCHR